MFLMAGLFADAMQDSVQCSHQSASTGAALQTGARLCGLGAHLRLCKSARKTGTGEMHAIVFRHSCFLLRLASTSHRNSR